MAASETVATMILRRHWTDALLLPFIESVLMDVISCNAVSYVIFVARRSVLLRRMTMGDGDGMGCGDFQMC